MTDEIQIRSSLDNPEQLGTMMEFVKIMRTALAPRLNAEIVMLEQNQCVLISACAFLAGLTAGHLITFGGLQERDKKRAGDVVLHSFREGIRHGKKEAEAAIAADAMRNGGTVQ